MGMKIFWTDKALFQLEEIFYYYKLKASLKVAKKIVKDLVVQTIILENNPRSGHKEELLADRQNEFRFLVKGNYKIIYWIEEKSNLVYIASIFDTRQNPEKIKNI